MKEIDINFIKATLLNDEASSDKELIDHFTEQCKITRKEADFYVDQRNLALKWPWQFELIIYKQLKIEDST